MEVNSQHNLAAAFSRSNESTVQSDAFRELLNTVIPKHAIDPENLKQAPLQKLLSFLQQAQKLQVPDQAKQLLIQFIACLETYVFNLATLFQLCLLYDKKRNNIPLQQRFSWLYDEVHLLAEQVSAQALNTDAAQTILKEIELLSEQLGLNLEH